MSIVVDTGVLYADHDEGAPRHDIADSAMDAIYRGKKGQPFVSDYIFDETVTLTLKRSGRFDAARSIGRRIRGVGEFADVFSFEHVDPGLFQRSVDVFERYDDQELSFTDATTVAIIEERDLDSVLSFDDDFDGIVDRTDPADLA